MKEWRKRRIAQGLCAICGRPIEGEFVACADCRKRRNLYPSRDPLVTNAYFAERRVKLGRMYGAYQQQWRFSYKLKLIDLFGGRCIRCGETNPLVLTLNHLGGLNGPRGRGGYLLYLDIIKGRKEKSGFDLRCYNCQILYEFERGAIFSEIAGQVKSEIARRGTRRLPCQDAAS